MTDSDDAYLAWRAAAADDPVTDAIWCTRQLRTLDEQRDKVAAQRRTAMRRALETMTATELAEKMGITKGRVSQILQAGK